MTYQILATKCLKVESMKVYEQLVSLSTIFESASTIPEMEIIAHEAEDSRKIMDYLMRG